VAEGCGRRSDGEFTRFLQIARGSASELEYHLLLSHDLGILADEGFEELRNKLIEVQRMLTALVQRVQPQGAAASVVLTRGRSPAASS
jgi:four helix bundle protein